VPSVGLGAEQRGVGISDESIDIGGVLGIDRAADAEPNGNQLAADLEGLCHGIEQALGQSLRGLGLVTSDQNEGEFIAAHAGNEGVIGGVLQAPRNGAEKLVANNMAEQVVGLLEMIEIDSQDGEARAVVSCAHEGLGELLGKGGAVGQIGERVVMGEMGNVSMPAEELGSGGTQLLARFVEAERGFPYLFLQYIEALSHLAELVAGIRPDRYDADRCVGSLEIAAA
jgi:hypothetical protein